uniref:CUB domain-containing protein n=1 Tax=Panagrolaimus davidi TaxID=227884 RepID=A0A914QQT5_9BILA
MVSYTLDLTPYSAVQGFVLFDDWGDGCPMESVARVNPYHFEDETQIITVQSVYGNDYVRNHPCFWQFSAPKGYGFKLIFEPLHLLDSVDVRIDNSNETILT